MLAATSFKAPRDPVRGAETVEFLFTSLLCCCLTFLFMATSVSPFVFFFFSPFDRLSPSRQGRPDNQDEAREKA